MNRQIAPSGPAEPSAGRPVDHRLATLQIGLAESDSEIAAAQELRYPVFYEEMSAGRPPP